MGTEERPLHVLHPSRGAVRTPLVTLGTSLEFLFLDEARQGQKTQKFHVRCGKCITNSARKETHQGTSGDLEAPRAVLPSPCKVSTAGTVCFQKHLQGLLFIATINSPHVQLHPGRGWAAPLVSAGTVQVETGPACPGTAPSAFQSMKSKVLIPGTVCEQFNTHPPHGHGSQVGTEQWEQAPGNAGVAFAVFQLEVSKNNEIFWGWDCYPGVLQEVKAAN